MNERIEHRAAEELLPSQHPCQQQREGQAEQHAARRDAQAQNERFAFVGAQPHHGQLKVRGIMRLAVYCARVRTPDIRIRSMPYFHAVTPLAASQDTSPARRIGVLLVNLGTPDSPTYFAVQRYLRQFLSDRRVIDTSRLIWLPLLYGVVLPLRPLRTARNYRKIWMTEGSPLAVYSRRLAAKINSILPAALKDQVRIGLAMTYRNPGIEQAMQSFAETRAGE